MALAALAIGLTGCGRREAPLRIGVNVWPGYEPLFLARSLGYYDDRHVQLIDFPNSTEAIRAYRNGAIDVVALTADEALAVASTQSGQRIFLVCDVSRGADAILARPEFPSMKALAGRRVGTESTALGALMLARALDLAGMKSGDVTVVPVPAEEHEEAYAAGRVDAIVTFEPRRSRLLAAGTVRVFDSTEIPGEITDMLVARTELVTKRRVEFEALVAGWFRALDYLRKHPEDAARRMAPREQTTPEEFLASLAGIELADQAANTRLLGPGPGNLVAPLQRLSAIMVGHNLLPAPVDPAPLLEGSLHIPKAR